MIAATVIDNTSFNKKPAIIKEIGYKNLLTKQSESDKKAFPVILESLRPELRNEAPKYKGQTIHSLIRVILTMHIEKAKILEGNDALTRNELLAIHNISVEEICRFMVDYRNNNPDVSLRSLNNIQLIRLSMVTLIKKRMEFMNKRKEMRLKLRSSCGNVLLLFND